MHWAIVLVRELEWLPSRSERMEVFSLVFSGFYICYCLYISSGDTSVSVTEQLQGGSNMTGTDLYVNKPHCAAAVRPWESEATTSTLPPARVRTCSVLSGSC